MPGRPNASLERRPNPGPACAREICRVSFNVPYDRAGHRETLLECRAFLGTQMDLRSVCWRAASTLLRRRVSITMAGARDLTLAFADMDP
jgi:hypothetical protein